MKVSITRCYGVSGSDVTDIFHLLLESDKKGRLRTELLKSLGIKEYFIDGDISIDKKTCLGVECRLCIKVCPTNALYWSNGQVNITKDLCIYCTACVLICMVDDCIKITRKRADGRIETFSKPKDVVRILQSHGAKKRLDILSRISHRYFNGGYYA